MGIWILTNAAGHIIALNPNNMSGNSGWLEITVETAEINQNSELHDVNGAALYALENGAVVLRDEAARQAELAAQAAGVPAPEQTDAERIASLEQQIALLLGGDTN